MLVSQRLRRRRLHRASYVQSIPETALASLRPCADQRPVCGSLARGNEHRTIREGDRCECDEGWEGINCNVCNQDKACNALMESEDGGVCYQMGNVLKNNYQMCDVTNEKIRDLLGEQVPQVTFTCDASDSKCDFQCKQSSGPIQRAMACSVRANRAQSGWTGRSPSFAPWANVNRPTTLPATITKLRLPAKPSSANVYQIECCVAKATLSTSPNS